jgi:hypothetical protein
MPPKYPFFFLRTVCMLSTIISHGGQEIAKIEGEVLPFEPLKELGLRGEIVAYLSSF